MKRPLLWGLGATGLVLAGVLIWFYSTTGIDESTADVTAPTLAAAPEPTQVPATEPDETTPEASSQPVGDDDPYGPGADPAQTLPQDDVTDDTEPVAVGGGTVFALADDSTVTFELDEAVRGSDSHVVATNNEVEGQLRIDPADLSTVELGTIVVGAQTFETDSSNRDRAIRGPILNASAFPEITFVPTILDGLSGAATVGTPFSFTITGDLTIRDVTQQVTFDAIATLESDDLVEGVATGTVSREAFGLIIPSVAAVADVSDDVILTIDFLAGPA